MLAALLPWELAGTDRRRAIEVVWWITAASHRRGCDRHGRGRSRRCRRCVDVATWLVGVSATAATIAIWSCCWWRRRGDPTTRCRCGSPPERVAAWLAVVPEQIDIGPQAPLGDEAGALLLLATVPLLVVGVRSCNALRERPGASTASPTR